MDVNNISLQADDGDDEEDWRQVTSADVVARARNIWDKCGYVWGGFPGTQSQAALGANGKSYLTGAKGTPYATDCSGFVAWCWGFHQRMFSTHDMRFGSRWKFTKKVSSTGIIEQDMPGIIPGDALVRNNGSASIYLKNVLVTDLIEYTSNSGDDYIEGSEFGVPVAKNEDNKEGSDTKKSPKVEPEDEMEDSPF